MVCRSCAELNLLLRDWPVHLVEGDGSEECLGGSGAHEETTMGILAREPKGVAEDG